MKMSISIPSILKRCLSYVQGQSPEPKIREYFYYVDHQGMLFLDDSKMKNFTSCFKEKKFLQFFFKNLRRNQTGRYASEFPFVSPCGRERNFIRCDDRPIVYTRLMGDSGDTLSYGHADHLLTAPFQPERLVMFPQTGRVYHPAPERAGSVGLVHSKLATELSEHFEFANEAEPPTHIRWKGTRIRLDREWYKNL